VRWFAVSVRIATLSKSRDEISVREREGYDTPSVTIAATVPKW
jgi:hypothetical protein